MHGEDKQNMWQSESGFIWSMIGSAVGFANILGFSSKAYRHGGGAFFIPFLIALVLLGIPLLFLEGVIGQQFAEPLVSAFGRVAGKKGKFFGWLSVLACLTIGAFYTVLTGWSIAYTYFTVVDAIPDQSGAFFSEVFLRDSGSILIFGGVAWWVLIFTAIVMYFSWYVMSRNIQAGVERLCSIFLPLLSILVFLFAFGVMFLPGAMQGFKLYLWPDFTRLAEPKLWLEAFGHLFFSLSLGLGIVTGYSRHADKTVSIPRAMFWVVVGDFVISFIAGFAIFGCVGYMSQLQGLPFASIIKSTSNFEMGFILFPQILKTFGTLVYRIMGPLFFFSIFIAGVTGVFSIIESVAGNIEIEFNTHRSNAVTIAVLAMSALGIFFCMGNGMHIVGALEPMVTGFNMLLGGIAEVAIFMFMSPTIAGHEIWQVGDKRSYAYYALRYVIIGLLSVILLSAIVAEINSGFGIQEIVRWGWFAGAALTGAYLAKVGVETKVKP